jgi:uncharacterized repeat protein (TIGR01451 family)
VAGFAQASAYQPPNLSQCNNEVFNLNVQTPIILGTQPTPQFSVVFYFNGTAISNPQAFVPNAQTAQVTAIVTNNSDNSFASTFFNVSWGMGPPLPQYYDITVCDAYYLPDLPLYANYYTGPNGTGQILAAGDAVTFYQTIYVYAYNGSCSTQRNFTVIVVPVPIVDVSNVTSCNEYVLPALPPWQQYYTGPNATGTAIPAGTVISATTTLFVYAQSQGGAPYCSSEDSFTISIGNPPINPTVSLSSCDGNSDGFASFNLSSATVSVAAGGGQFVSFHATLTDAENGTAPLISPYMNITPFTQIVYTRVTSNNGSCFSTGQLQLSVVNCGTISGVVRTDMDQNGCTAADAPAANIQIAHAAGNTVTYAYTNANGEYSFPNVLPGTHNVYVVPVTSMTVTPTSQNVTVSGASNQVANFCMAPVLPVNDAAVYYYSIVPPRPGLTSMGYVYIRNVGTTVSNGYVSLGFDSAKMTFSAALPTPDVVEPDAIYFYYSNLQPHEVRSYRVDFIMGIPPGVSSGDVVAFEAFVNPNGTDLNEADNTYVLNQTVVNSYDPNDKSVHETSFSPDNTTDYLHYMVRFQNTGTADAIDVRVEDQLDTNLNWSTFRPLAASHNFTTHRDANGRVTFTFANINLLPNSEDEAGSNGFVTFEVKLKAGLNSNYDIYNTAEIYFDFNPPIITNTVMTDLGSLGIVDLAKNMFVMYPNPAAGVVNIQVQDFESFSVELFDVQGKKIVENKADGPLSMDVSSLQKGMYLVRVTTAKGSETKKLIVR